MKIEFKKNHLSFVYNTIFFPFTYPEINESLEKKKYTAESKPLDMPSSIPAGARAYLSGHIATKDDCKVIIDDHRKILAVVGKLPSKVREVFLEVGEIVEKDFGIKSSDIDYIELVSEAIVTDDKKPINVIQPLFEELKIVKKFDKILEEETALFEIRITPKDKSPNSKNWFDVRIIPSIINPNVFDVRVIYRDENIEKVKKFASKIQQKIEDLIKEIGS